MTARPILFSAPMVRALLAGRKTKTRRVVTYRHFYGSLHSLTDGMTWSGGVFGYGGMSCNVNGGMYTVPGRFPYGEVGGVLWVKEGFALAPASDDPDPEIAEDWHVHYRADWDGRPWRSSTDEDAVDVKPPWRSPLYMPRWASRITLRVTSVRVERLQEISEEDARAEGMDWAAPLPQKVDRRRRQDDDREDPREVGYPRASDSFAISNYRTAWDCINGKRAPWDSNPWVWVVGFEVKR